jgi:hypothetical protein
MSPSGWLNRQLERVSEDVKSWPLWMRREAGLEDASEVPDQVPSAELDGKADQDRGKEFHR